MKRVRFIMGKNPAEFTGGDTVVSRLMINLARESYDVEVIALSQNPIESIDGVRIAPIAKPQISKPRLLASSASRGRSLIHSRFDVEALSTILKDTDADAFVAEHSYMAEAFLSARGGRAAEQLWINTHVSESDVMRQSGGALARIEAPRLWKDELRVAKRARRIGCFDTDELDRYEGNGVTGGAFLDITMKPAERSHRGSGEPRLVFLGDRNWKPNMLALEWMLRLWPSIHARAGNDARLAIVGKGPRPDGTQQIAGVEYTGFVEDLDGYLTHSRALIAPISVGGGVRVKILESAAIGLPVVANSVAIGSLNRILPLTTSNTDEEIIERATLLLLDAERARREGQELYDANLVRWEERAPHSTIERWIS
jgi:hypothetical protein